MRVKSLIIGDIERNFWYRHIQRMDGNRLSKEVIEWIPPERKKDQEQHRRWGYGRR